MHQAQVCVRYPGRAAVRKAGGWSVWSHQQHCPFVQQSPAPQYVFCKRSYLVWLHAADMFKWGPDIDVSAFSQAQETRDRASDDNPAERVRAHQPPLPVAAQQAAVGSDCRRISQSSCRQNFYTINKCKNMQFCYVALTHLCARRQPRSSRRRWPTPSPTPRRRRPA